MKRIQRTQTQELDEESQLVSGGPSDSHSDSGALNGPQFEEAVRVEVQRLVDVVVEKEEIPEIGMAVEVL